VLLAQKYDFFYQVREQFSQVTFRVRPTDNSAVQRLKSAVAGNLQLSTSISPSSAAFELLDAEKVVGANAVFRLLLKAIE
jgi:hypothetical protein